MTFLGKKVAVAIPDTVLEERDSTREKTTKLGLIARACAIYGVDLVEVFRDPRGKGESKRITKVLEYLETPQYLRRRVFPLDEDLKYAGLLPPLRTPSHKPRVSLQDLEVGEIREGVTNADGSVDVGLDRAPLLRGKTRADVRVTVKITSKNPLTAEPVTRDAVKEYWGYLVESRTLDDTLGDARFPLKIATSRLGDPLKSQLPPLREAFSRNSQLMLLFGSPSRGLFDLVGPRLRERVDFVVNLFAEQNVQTVRMEEAVFAALGLLGFLS
ncbi:MAG TPA: putative RNA uridine N3 methyltransferase [Nitrososphaerales archaeon]|nr:putative RNA uridine N3 methyltransferase [Nitrososphaerales archaeon]